jgi:peptide/nickel transport system permease protein
LPPPGAGLSLGGYVVRRLLHLVPIALGVTILVFFLIHLVPGDPARTILGNQATDQRVALLRHSWGLDRPLPVQYEKFMARTVRGDLGTSLFYGVSAGRLVFQRLPVTLWLIGFGALLSVLIAVPLAALAATHRDRIPDHLVRAVPLVGLGFPPFWVGIVLLLVFGLHLGRGFPVGGYGYGFAGHLHSMFLPALTVAFGIAPILVRSLRASLLEVLESDYVVTARAKGLPERRVLTRHALRNAVISTVSVLGVNIGYLVGGTLVIEQVYALPGIGQLMINSINQRDFPVVQGVTLVFSVMVVLVYLLTDVAHALLDPRVRFE